MVIKRLISPIPSHNERNVIYTATSLEEDACMDWLDASRDGVYGLEGFKTQYGEHFNMVTPNFFKHSWEYSESDILQDFLNVNSKDATYVQFQLVKPSVFPLEMELSKSIVNTLKMVTEGNISLFYQFLFQFRQDNWVDRLEDQYDDYLQGVETPSNNQTIRKFQLALSKKVDEFFKWEFKHSPIDEMDEKLMQDGYRFNFKLVLIGGLKKQRIRLVHQITNLLNSVSYLNNWSPIILPLTEDIVSNLVKRKLNTVGKLDVLCTSELIPFLTFSKGAASDLGFQKREVKKGLPKPLPINRNPLLDLLPRGKEVPTEDGEHYADKFVSAVKDLLNINEDILLKNIQYGATLIKLTFEIPRELKMSQLVKKSSKDDIQVAMGVRNIVIEQGENIGEMDLLVPLKKRRKVLLRDYLDTSAFKLFVDSNPLPFLVGVDTIGKPIYRDLNKAKHILTGGTTGSGKSTFINQIILTLAMFKRPSEVEMYLVDVKQVELTHFKDFPHVKSLITTSDGAKKLLEDLIVEMKRRFQLLEEKGVKNIGIYNYKHPEEKLPYIVCIVDEYAELTLDSKEIHKLVQSISQLARAAGIHLVIATQDPRKEIIPPIIKSNMPSKVAFVCSNENSYLTFLRAKPYHKLLGNGDGVIAFDGQSEDFIRFQGCMIADDAENMDAEVEVIEKIAKAMKKLYSGGTEQGYSVFDESTLGEVLQKSDKEVLMETIVQYNETRVGQLRDIMRINIKKLSVLMRELVEEGFLAEPETRQSGYKLIASEDEIARIRESISHSKD